jgi:transcription antitermination factor NusG
MIKNTTHKAWYVIYSGFKKEKVVCTFLNKKDIRAYVPLMKKTRVYTRKVKRYEVPLISCYVFVYINPGQCTQVLETEFVYGFVKCGKVLTPIPQKEIDLLRQIAGDASIEEIIPLHDVSPGRRVELVAGTLTGIQGKVVEKTGKSSCLIELETLGYAVRIRVDVNQLRDVA